MSSSSRRHRGWEIPGCDWSTQLCFLLIGRGLVTKLIVADKEPPTTTTAQQQLWRVEREGVGEMELRMMDENKTNWAENWELFLKGNLYVLIIIPL